MEEIRGVRDDLLEIHGVEPRKKPEGCTWLIYENPDGFNNRISGNEKLDKAKEIIDELEADIHEEEFDTYLKMRHIFRFHPNSS